MTRPGSDRLLLIVGQLIETDEEAHPDPDAVLSDVWRAVARLSVEDRTHLENCCKTLAQICRVEGVRT